LVAQPIQFSSCFISYSAKDQDFAERLHTDLQNSGVRCWFSPHDVKGGKKLHLQIDDAIWVCDRVLLILSEHSMGSEWVKTEIAYARQKELSERRQVLFPVTIIPFERVRSWKCFDGDIGKDSAREIREYFIPDFSGWKDGVSYRAPFNGW
jgi:TIR domain-containing protein